MAGRPLSAARFLPTVQVPMRVDVLVLNAALRQSLVAVRSLGRRGLRVAAVGACRSTPAFASRWCAQAALFPPEEAMCAYGSALEAWLEHSSAPVLIASSDCTIALMRAHRVRLDPNVRVALADEGPLGVAISKEQTLAMAQCLGLRVPRGVVVRTPGDVAEAVGEVGLPAVIKPCESWLWDGREGTRLSAELAVTPAEARRAVERVTHFGQSALFQELLTGRREAVSFLYASGTFYARFAQWAKRMCGPLGGDSVLRQAIAIPPDIGGQAEALIRAIGLEGYSEVEFRRDASGVPYLMEINPRLSASVEVAVRAGVDFPYLVYQWASGVPIEPVLGYRVGGWIRHLGGDFWTTYASLKQRGRPGVSPPVRSVLDFGLSFLKPMAYDYLDWRDPLPAVRAVSGFTRDAVKKLLSGAGSNGHATGL